MEKRVGVVGILIKQFNFQSKFATVALLKGIFLFWRVLQLTER